MGQNDAIITLPQSRQHAAPKLSVELALECGLLVRPALAEGLVVGVAHARPCAPLVALAVAPQLIARMGP